MKLRHENDEVLNFTFVIIQNTESNSNKLDHYLF